jgi:hypothetical protein
VAEGFFIAGTIPFALLGSTHLALTLRDVRRRGYFKPTDDAPIPALEASGVALMAPAAGPHTMWRAWLGAKPHAWPRPARLRAASARRRSARLRACVRHPRHPAFEHHCGVGVRARRAALLVPARGGHGGRRGSPASSLPRSHRRIRSPADSCVRPKPARVHAAFECRIRARCDRAVHDRSRIRATSGRLLRPEAHAPSDEPQVSGPTAASRLHCSGDCARPCRAGLRSRRSSGGGASAGSAGTPPSAN